MREILFKAKRIDNGEWVEGYLVHDEFDKLYRIITKLEYSTGTCITAECAPRVDANTICQYIGLTDKNGRKIWENDIVLEVQPCKRTFKITYDVDAFCFDGHNIMLRVRNARDKVEVIGNAFDNPELLEKAR